MPVRIISPILNVFRKNGRLLIPKKVVRRKKSSVSSRAKGGDLPGSYAADGIATLPPVARNDMPTRKRMYADHSNSVSGKNILMFGWELPPFNSGGLGVASYGLAKALAYKGANITFVLPRRVDIQVPFMRLVFASDKLLDPADIHRVSGYTTSRRGAWRAQGLPFDDPAGELLEEVLRYARAARRIARQVPHDLIHAHDWLTYPAAMVAKRVAQRPYVAHVHATEFDRSGGESVNTQVYAIEHEGFHRSDRIIAVSGYTRNLVVNRYGIAPGRVHVVHNGVEISGTSCVAEHLQGLKRSGKKLVLFVGRITMQKGPDYFLHAAARVIRHDPDTLFIMSGSGDMERQMMMLAAHLGISDHLLFAGFLRGQELESVYRAADVFVMPSISEPFGIAALESMAYDTPVIVSKQSGVAEILTHALKVDFWDTEEMAHKILAVLRYGALQRQLRVYGRDEVQEYTWEKAANECAKVYQSVM